jgi:polyferredoxin
LFVGIIMAVFLIIPLLVVFFIGIMCLIMIYNALTSFNTKKGRLIK